MKIIIEYLQSENNNLDGAVNLATNYSQKNSHSSDYLLELSYFCGLNEYYSLAYIFAKTCTILTTENSKKELYTSWLVWLLL